LFFISEAAFHFHISAFYFRQITDSCRFFASLPLSSFSPFSALSLIFFARHLRRFHAFCFISLFRYLLRFHWPASFCRRHFEEAASR
jgi:hypothetical protein